MHQTWRAMRILSASTDSGQNLDRLRCGVFVTCDLIFQIHNRREVHKADYLGTMQVELVPVPLIPINSSVSVSNVSSANVT